MNNFVDKKKPVGTFDSSDINEHVGQARVDDDQINIIDLEPKQPTIRTSHPFLLSRVRLQSLQKSTWTKILTASLLVSALVLFFVVQPGWPSLFKANKAVTTPPSDILQVIPANDMVFLNLVDGTLQARKANNGTLRWHKKKASKYDTRFLATTETIVYSASSRFGNGVVEAFRASDGKDLWEYQTPDLTAYALVAQDTLLYVHTVQGMVLALDGRDGSLLWQFHIGSYQSIDSYLYTGEGIVALYASDDKVHVLRTEDGTEILNYKPGYNWHFAAENGMIYIDRPGLRLEALRIQDGSLAWRYPSNMPSEYQIELTKYFPLFWQVKDGVIYIDAGLGVLEALRADDGKSLWQYNFKSDFSSDNVNYTIQGGIICISNELGNIMMIHAKDGSRLWLDNFNISKPRPQIAGDVLYIESSKQSIDVWRISEKRHLWEYTTATSIRSYPTISKENMYLLSVNSTEGLKLDVIMLVDGAVLWSYPIVARKS